MIIEDNAIKDPLVLRNNENVKSLKFIVVNDSSLSLKVHKEDL
jgi:hypothetical protein